MQIYLAGAIEKSKDGGIWIRQNVRNALDGINYINLIDPCDFKFNKKYKSLGELVENNRQWKSIARKVIENDINAVVTSDVIIVVVNRLAGGGTITESVFAHRNGVPVIGYFSKDVFNNRKGLHPWLLASLTDECDNVEDLVRIVESYKLKEKRDA